MSEFVGFDGDTSSTGRKSVTSVKSGKRSKRRKGSQRTSLHTSTLSAYSRTGSQLAPSSDDLSSVLKPEAEKIDRVGVLTEAAIKSAVSRLDVTGQFLDVQQSTLLTNLSADHCEKLALDEAAFLKEHLAQVYKELIAAKLENLRLQAKLKEKRRRSRRKYSQSWLELQVVEGDKVLCKRSMWLVLNKTTLSAYVESENLEQPEHVFDLYEASLSLQDTGILHLNSRHVPAEWILQSEDTNLVSSWQEALMKARALAKRQGLNRPISRAFHYCKLLENEEKAMLEESEVELKGYNRLVELRRTCFDQIVKDLVTLQTK